ncbi:EmrB/QacA subfamily drug resistance transporter [Nocardia mexicana]|uniref:EmrB/QacA subfamily drug resistance transporter n=2 Tax=Nocardia mexicana TaxID=279262 RepID=A0A370H3A9_9NOCA|nr:EmrB/QacA subfamily drug resistance transporter [Nocardia mexicana]
MTHRQIMEALSGLLLGMFAAIISSTIVSAALPKIIGTLGGGQTAYTWVVTAALLAMTAATPLWGKLADLYSKKALVQIALLIYIAGSVVAGLSQNAGMLIACRAVQGIGAGGLSALAQIVMAAMIAPRERGRYSGYLGAVFAVATVGGPLLGGVITDTSWLGWRWCFYVGVPFALIALVVLQKTLHLPVLRREVKVDWLGAFLVTASVCLLLVWVSFAGSKYDWLSWQTAVMVAGSLALALLFVFVELKASEPIVPMRLFRNRTISLASAASLMVGTAMFAGTVFFSQYFQLARGKSPTMSGVMTIPMIAGLFVASTVSGQVITRTGRWKAWLVCGAALLTAGLGLLGSIRYDTDYWLVALYMALMGLGIGMMMQNLVLCTQNQVAAQDLGAASSLVSFFRSLGGAIGVSALGAIMAGQVRDHISDGLTRLGPGAAQAMGGGAGSDLPNMAVLPAPVRTVVEEAYGHGIADVFLYAAPVALIAFLLTLFIKEVALRTSAVSESANAATPDLLDDTTLHSPSADNVPRHGFSPSGNGTAAHRLAVSGNGAPAYEHPHTAADALEYGYTQSGNDIQGQGRSQPGNDVPRQGYSRSGGPTHGRPPSGDGVRMTGYVPTGEGIPVHGYVSSADGAPLPGAALTLISPQGGQVGRVIASEDGSFAVDAPAPGPFVLIASADGYQPQAAPITVGGSALGHDFRLSGLSGLAGMLRTADDGTPVADAVVIVTDSRGDVMAAGASGADGKYELAELVPGHVTVAVNATSFQPLAVSAEVRGQGITHLDLALRRGARLRGTVHAPQGPLPDARVTLIDAGGAVVGTATTAADGTYAFTNIGNGDYMVVASGYPATTTAVALHPGEGNAHDIELTYQSE